MKRKFSFENLEVWQNAIDLSIDVYQLTKNFPDDEKFVLVSQLRRAALSISSNIAEGNGRETNNYQARFTTMAYSSLMELLNQLIFASKLGYVTENQLDELREKMNYISNQLTKLKKYKKNRLSVSSNNRLTK